MAGIGFELKGLFKRKGYVGRLGAYFISSMVTVGPTIMCILIVLCGKYFLKLQHESVLNENLFLGTIIYSFAFSLIVTGGLSMFGARYVSDCIYQKKLHKIFPSFLGLIIVTSLIIFVGTVIFLWGADISPFLKVLTYFLILQLSIIWIESVYVSAIKDYISIVIIYLIGTIITVGIIFIQHRYTLVKIDNVKLLLMTINLGFLIITILLFFKLYRILGWDKYSLTECFQFVKKIKSYPQLLAIGSIFYIGMYAHNFVFWIFKMGTNVFNTYRIFPIYDVPMFFAFITIIPSMVLFVVEVETEFYYKYNNYYQKIRSGGGNIKDILLAKDEMVRTLSLQFRHIISVQLMVSTITVLLGFNILPKFGLSLYLVNIFCLLAIGCVSYVLMNLLCIVLLYFDDRKGTFVIALIFAIGSILASYISVKYGEQFYGYDFFIAAIISLILAVLRVSSVLKNIEYRTFGHQPLYGEEDGI